MFDEKYLDYFMLFFDHQKNRECIKVFRFLRNESKVEQ